MTRNRDNKVLEGLRERILERENAQERNAGKRKRGLPEGCSVGQRVEFPVDHCRPARSQYKYLDASVVRLHWCFLLPTGTR